MVRRHLRGRQPGIRRITGQGQARLRPGPGGEDQIRRLALRLVVGDREEHPEIGRRLEVHLLGVREEYENLVGTELGWSRVPAGKRASTYENPQYLEAAEAFAEPTKTAITEADPTNPGVQPRPTVGIQFVDIPEFTALGTKVSQDISSAIAGQMSVDRRPEQGPGTGHRRSG